MSIDVIENDCADKFDINDRFEGVKENEIDKSCIAVAWICRLVFQLTIEC